jgi:membrane protease subunit HflC
MQAYERSMQHGDTHLVLKPDSDFFRFFGDPTGKEGAAAGGAQAGASAAAPPPANPPRAQR